MRPAIRALFLGERRHSGGPLRFPWLKSPPRLAFRCFSTPERTSSASHRPKPLGFSHRMRGGCFFRRRLDGLIEKTARLLSIPIIQIERIHHWSRCPCSIDGFSSSEKCFNKMIYWFTVKDFPWLFVNPNISLNCMVFPMFSRIAWIHFGHSGTVTGWCCI